MVTQGKNPYSLRISQYISTFNGSVRSTNLTVVKSDNDLSCMRHKYSMKLKWIHTFQTFASHLETACICLDGGFTGELVSGQISAITSKQINQKLCLLKGFQSGYFLLRLLIFKSYQSNPRVVHQQHSYPDQALGFCNQYQLIPCTAMATSDRDDIFLPQ